MSHVGGDGVSVTESSNTSPGTVESQASHTAEWTIDVSDSASGQYTVTVTASFTLDGEEKTVTRATDFLVGA